LGIGWKFSIAEAARVRFRHPDGLEVPKFVYLDMEEYRDLWLTAEAFMRTLDRDGLHSAEAGIRPASVSPGFTHCAKDDPRLGGKTSGARWGTQSRSVWSRAPIWKWSGSKHHNAIGPQAPYLTKRETDANYKRMLHEAMGGGGVLRLGVASHNLFDLAYALILATERWLPGPCPVRDA